MRKRSQNLPPLREPVDEPLSPANTEAEQALLGAIMLNEAAYHAVCNTLYDEHFYEPVHSRIYAAIGQLIDGGSPANPVTLHARFANDAALAKVGGAGYLGHLVEAAVSIVNAPHYAEAVLDAYRRRVLIAAAEDLRERAFAYEDDDPVDKQIEEAGSRLFDLTAVGAGHRGPVRGGEAAQTALAGAERAYREPGKLAGISSGIAALDRLLGGFAPGDLYIFGGRPGSGKSSLMTSVAWAALDAGHPCLIFSGEMTAPQLMARLIASLTGISAGRQRRGDLTAPDWEMLIDAQQRIAAWPLLIDDGPMTLARIRQQLRVSRRRNKTALAMIDYLQLVTSSGGADETRLAEVGRVSNGLKRAAKDLDLPIIALAQLSRAVEGRDDKRPLMADLRQSGEIEQDADAVVLLFREEIYLARAEPKPHAGEDDIKFGARHALWSNALFDAKGKATLIIAKNRHDREGVANVRFDAERSLFHDPTDAQQGLF